MTDEAFRDLLIPTTEASVFWKRPDDRGEHAFAIAVVSTPKNEDDRRIYRRLADDYKNFSRSMPAYSSVKLDDCSLIAAPEHLFADIISELGDLPPVKFRAAIWETIRQFARIESCEWARRMYEQRDERSLAREDLEPFCILPDGSRIRLG